MAQRPDKQQAHELLEHLDAGQLAAVVHLLQAMTDPLASAAMEEEEIAAETAAAIERGRASLARGEGIAHEAVRSEFGLTK